MAVIHFSQFTRSAMLVIALLGACATVSAQTPPVQTPAKPLLWNQLSRPQQVALEPLLAEWDKMDAARKQKWLEIANRYSSMKPDEQQRMHERMRDWLKLTPEERRVARENYTLSKKLGKNQKSVQWEQYQALPEEEKKKLAADAASKKQVTNLPPKTQPKAIAPTKPAPAKPAPASTPPVTPAAPVPNVK
ncbi:MAG: DUF3106 domain-containing protein [Pseudomonadota bacterium]